MLHASPLGILVTIILLGILITIHESGHFLAAKSIKVPVRQFAIGFGPKLFGFTWGETECRLNILPLGGYCAFEDDQKDGKEEEPPSDDPRFLRNRPVYQRVWVVSMGVIFNFISAWLILWMSVMALGAPTGHQLVYVQKVIAGTPAAHSGLQAGDQILTIQKQPFSNFDAFRARLLQLKDKPISLAIQRDGHPQTIAVTPTNDGKLGFAPMIKEDRLPVHNPIKAAKSATHQQITVTQQLWGALGMLFTKPSEMMKETGGPLTIVAVGDQIFQHDPMQLINLAVLLSIELAIINILPLPALDGGHLLMLLIEKLRGRPLPRRVEEGILMTGFILIMGLGVLLILKDIVTVPGMYSK